MFSMLGLGVVVMSLFAASLVFFLFRMTILISRLFFFPLFLFFFSLALLCLALPKICFALQPIANGYVCANEVGLGSRLGWGECHKAEEVGAYMIPDPPPERSSFDGQ